MAKVIFLLGLAGSGKSFLAERLKRDFGLEIFEGPEGDPAIKERMLGHLSNGGSCVVEEIAYCMPSCREKIVRQVIAVAPDLKIEWQCFENDIESANWNVTHRQNKADAPGHLRINQIYRGLYIYPGGATPIPIVRVKESEKTA